VVLVVAWLLAALPSGVIALTCAVFDTVPPLVGAVTTSVIVDDAPLASDASRQVTSWFTAEHDQSLPDALTKPTPAGRVSSTLTPDALPGPPFDTVIV
jgi:hypothetical protein